MAFGDNINDMRNLISKLTTKASEQDWNQNITGIKKKLRKEKSVERLIPCH